MTWINKPRPKDPGGELAQSRKEQRIELTEIRGLAGVREIRRRLALARAAKERAGGRLLTEAELDLVVEPTDCGVFRGPKSGAFTR